MTPKEYLENPMGKGAATSMLNAIRPQLNATYEKAQGTMRGFFYLYKDNIMLVHVKVPSGSFESLFYDVIIQFDISDPSSKNLGDIPFKVFSNCPSFTYTYGKVFKERGLFIDWCENKYEAVVMEKNPDIRNPFHIVSYEKSLYLALKYIMSGGRYNVTVTKPLAKPITSLSNLLNDIQTSKDILEKYRNYKRKASGDKKKEEIQKRIQPTTKNSSNPSKSSVSYTKKVSKTSKSKKSRKI